MSSGAGHVLAFFAALVAVTHAYAAFSPPEAEWALYGPTLCALLACSLTAHATWRRAPALFGTPLREAMALLWTIVGMLGVLTLSQKTGAPESPTALPPWQLAVLVVAPTALALHSQASFVGFLSLHSGILLLALAVAPSGVAALSFMALSLMCCASLGQQESGERFPPAASGFGGLSWLRGAAPILTLLVGLFFVLSATKPDADSTTARDWILWLQGGRSTSGGVEGGRGTGAQGQGQGQGGSRRSEGEIGQGVSQGSAPEQGPARVGFSEDLKFGDVAGEDNKIVFYARVKRSPSGAAPNPRTLRPYWAGGALSRYVEGEWKGMEGREALEGPTIALPSETQGPLMDQDIVLLSGKGRALFGLYPIESITIDRALRDGEGRLRRVGSSVGRVRYTLRSRYVTNSTRRLRRDWPRSPDGRYFEVPREISDDPTFRALARKVRRQSSALLKIRAAMAIFRDFTYDLSPDLDPDADPTLAFLADKRGYCQHFASTLTLLLRESGVPARIGVGYAGGEWQFAGSYYVVRSKHAHAWVEVPFKRSGWVVFDPVSEALRDVDPRRPRRGPNPQPSEAPGPDPTRDPSETPSPSPSPRATRSPRASPSPRETRRPIPTRTPRPTPSGSPGEPRPVPTESPRESRPPPPPPPVERPSRRPSPRPSSTRDTPDLPDGGSESPFDRAWREAGQGGASSGGPDGGESGGEQGGGEQGGGEQGGGESGGREPGGGESGGESGGEQGGGEQGKSGAGRGAKESAGAQEAARAQRAPRPVDPSREVRASVSFAFSSLLRDLVAIALGVLVLAGLVRAWRAWRQREEEGERRNTEGALRWGADGQALSKPAPDLSAPGEEAREIVRLYLAATSAMGKRGRGRELTETPNEFVARVEAPRAEGPSAERALPVSAGQTPLARLTDLFVRARYGPWPLEESDLEEARGLARQVARERSQ